MQRIGKGVTREKHPEIENSTKSKDSISVFNIAYVALSGHILGFGLT